MPQIKTDGNINNNKLDQNIVNEKDLKDKEHSPDGKDLVIDKQPLPLNGAELSGIVVFRIAEALAIALNGNHKFGELIAYDNVKFTAKLNVDVESVSTVGMTNHANANFEVGINIDTKIHPSLVELLRAESGLGLWHRRATNEGKFVHIQARPAERVLEHIITMAKDMDLGSRSGFQSGVNNENYQPDANKL